MSKHEKRARLLHDAITQALKTNPKASNSQIAKTLVAQGVDGAWGHLRHVVADWRNLTNNPIPDQEIKIEEKRGLEIRGDNIVVNWTNRQIVTDLGEYGTYVASFDRHNLIQRKYVYAHGNETAAIVAMDFEFPHTKAVYIYARHHGFSKSSPPQTDLEFETGTTVEEAVEENIQTLKRRVYKKTQKREWIETMDAAAKWWNFENTSLEAIQAAAIELRQRQPLQLDLITIPTDYKFASFIGITDVHFMKLCYNHLGEVVYDRRIAIERLKQHTISLATETSRYGVPERFYVMIGNDNIHVDGLHQSTTKQTSQAQATEGVWRVELKKYIEMQIDLIEHYRQIAPVTIIPVKGNHDFETSIALQAFVEIYFRTYDDVDVIVCHDARAYVQYGKVCFVVTHGDEMRGIKNLESQAHKLIMGEAKLQGINTMEVEYYILLHGHEHVGSTRDLNGRVQRIGLSSMSGIDDWWHKSNGYVGRQNESQVIIIDPDNGRKAILYA
jgi:predicted phosphodiesterase